MAQQPFYGAPYVKRNDFGTHLFTWYRKEHILSDTYIEIPFIGFLKTLSISKKPGAQNILLKIVEDSREIPEIDISDLDKFQADINYDLYNPIIHIKGSGTVTVYMDGRYMPS